MCRVSTVNLESSNLPFVFSCLSLTNYRSPAPCFDSNLIGIAELIAQKFEVLMVAGFKSKKDRRAFFRARAQEHGGNLPLLEQLSNQARASFSADENDGIYSEFPPSVSSWEELPAIVDPGLYLPEERKVRKRAQLDYMCRAFAKLLQHLKQKQRDENTETTESESSENESESSSSRQEKRLTAIDFCSGGGHLGLILAACFPEIDVVCLERNPRNCERIEERKIEGNLQNVEVMCADVADALTVKDFDIGVAIHACGWMTDLVHAICLQRQASYVLCSCCVGKIAHPGPPESVQQYVMHPRSKRFQAKFTREQYLDMCKKADVEFYADGGFGLSNFGDDSFAVAHEVEKENRQDSEQKEDVCPPATTGNSQNTDSKETKDRIARRFCKTAVEVDRNAWSREFGYDTFLMQMPSWATPKNDIIVGYHKT